jgi:hypothetical protein
MCATCAAVVEREDAQIGVFVCMETPTRPVSNEAAEAGFYKPPEWDRYPLALEETFKKAPKARKATEEQMPPGQHPPREEEEEW